MKRKKYFIIEADDAEPPQRYLSGGLEFYNKQADCAEI